MEPITAKEIAIKLYRKKAHWFDGKPKVLVLGQSHSFGAICFVFKNDRIEIGAYLYNRECILQIAKLAVENFSVFINEFFQEVS